MASASTEIRPKNTLVLSKNPIPKTEISQSIQVFANLSDLIKYIYDHLKDVDNFKVHASNEYFEGLLKDGIQNIEQVRCVILYYENEQARKAGASRFPFGSKEAGLFKFHLGRILEGQLENSETAGVVDSSGPINRSALHNVTTSKKERLEEKQSSESHRYSPVPKRFAGASKSGPSIRSPITSLICPSCRTFFQEPYQLACGDRLCKSCLDNQSSCPTCSELISKDKARLVQALRNERQRSLVTCLECQWAGTVKAYQEHVNKNHLQGATFTFSNAVYISTDRTSEIRPTEQLSYQQHPILDERDENAQIASFDSTLTWQITDIIEKRMNVQLRQPPYSINSPPFYSSRKGYKMCVRLFLNGVNSARGTYMSLFLIIMRGDFDNLLHWPLSFKVTFSLLGQVQGNDQSCSFWSDPNSICFQKPRSDMNIGYGISQCFPLTTLLQDGYRFIHNGTLKIRIVVDFSTPRPQIPPNDSGNELTNDEEEENDTNDDNINADLCFNGNSNNTS